MRSGTRHQLNSVTENYGYYAIYQLLQVTQGANTTQSYGYDSVGNRLRAGGPLIGRIGSSTHKTVRVPLDKSEGVVKRHHS